MHTYNVNEAKTHLSALIDRVLAGEPIIIAKRGKPVAVINLYDPAQPPVLPKRKGGQWKGQIWISPDFDAPDPEIERLFYDGTIFPDEPKK